MKFGAPFSLRELNRSRMILGKSGSIPSGTRWKGHYFVAALSFAAHVLLAEESPTPPAVVSQSIFGENEILRGPVGVAVDDRKIYIADRGNSRIVVFDKNTRQVFKTFGSHGSGEGQFNQMNEVAVDDRYLYVTDRLNHRIQVFEKKDCSYFNEFGSKGRRPGQFNQPVGIYLDASSIYITDHENHRIQIFDKRTLKVLGTIGVPGNEDGNFFKPTGIVVDKDRIYVAEWGNNRIQIFDKTSRKFLAKIDNDALPPGESLKRPHGIAVTKTHIYVGGVANSCLFIFDKKTLKLVARIGSLGTKPGQIRQLHGFHIDGNLLYMPEYSNNRVQVWEVNAGCNLANSEQ